MSVGVYRRRVGVALMVSAIGLCALASGSASAAMKLRIAYNPNPTNTTIVVADKQGFFKKNGLDVKLTSSQAAAALVPALGKQFDLITTTPTDVLKAAANGLNPVLVNAQTIERQGKLRSSYLLGAKDITGIAGLKGKTIAVPSLAGVLYASLLMELNNAGIKANQVKIVQVPFPNMFDQLNSGQIQAAVDIFPFQGQILGAGFKDLGNPVLTVSKANQMMDAGWIANAKWATKNYKTIQAFRKSQSQALAWMKANPDAARQILVSDFQLPSFVAKTYPVTDYVSFHATSAYLSPWIKPLTAAGLLKKNAIKNVKALVLKGA